jgi:dTDP-4-dehydrorhamnose 3,5-epimerase
MKFTALSVQGCYLIEIEALSDERGYFARTFCRDEFSAQGLNADLQQCSVSFNLRGGTLRGMHYQKPPHEEDKLVRCTAGSIFDVILDLRQQSQTYLRWAGVELSASNHKSVYIPAGCAHGFLTLEDNSEVSYQMTQAYCPESAAGVRWDDPAFGIKWPASNVIISDRDSGYELWDDTKRCAT